MHLWAREHARTGTADAHVSFFTRVPPDPALREFGAYHGAELMYAYGTSARPATPTTPPSTSGCRHG